VKRWIPLLILFLPCFLAGQQVRFSLEGGWYDAAVTLRLESDGATIYYTLQGETPRPGSALYRGPLMLNSTTVVRAVACADGQCGREVSHTFFIHEPASTFPVVSVAIPPAMLFGEEGGLWREGPGVDRSHWKRPGANYWSKREVLAHVEMFEPDGQKVFGGNIGFRVFGGMSRTLPQKSFSLTARRQYGQKRIRHRVFGMDQPDRFKSLVFRNGGSDWGKAHFRDAFMLSLVEDWDIETQDHRPAHVYINGRYWGIYNIREKINRFFVEGLTGADRDHIDLLEHNGHPKKGSAAHYKRMLDYIERHDLAVDSHFAVVAGMMDVDNFMHYQIAQIYFDNRDAGGNIRFWRPRTADGRWRWILYDVDQGYGLHYDDAYRFNSLAFHTEARGPQWPNPPWSTFLLRNLLRNEGFRRAFITAFYDALHDVFEPERVAQRIDAFVRCYEPEMPRQLERWRIRPSTWEEHTERLYTFARYRPFYMRGHLAAYFDVGQAHGVCVSSTAGGQLRVNDHITLRDEQRDLHYPLGWPVRLEVEADLGYRFVGWEGLDGLEWQKTMVWSDDLVHLRAVFEPFRHPLCEQVIINEIGPNNKKAGDWIELHNRGDESVDVTSWIVADPRHAYRLPTSIIPPRGYLVLCEDPKRFKQFYPGVPVAAGAFAFGLNKREEAVYLYAYDGAWVDSVRYVVPAMDSLFTLSLLLPGLDNTDPSNWELRTGPGTPGAANPHFAAAHVYAEQQRWYRTGLLCGGILVLLFLAWAWGRHTLFRT
jgi:hypothetical protein